MDLGPEVGKRVAQSPVEDANTGFVGRGAGLRGVVDEVVGEQFVEQDEIALALNCSVLRRTTAFRASPSVSESVTSRL
jgi:hypothetical protein